MSDCEEYLRCDDTAAYLKVAVSTLAKWRVFGTGPVFTKAGRIVLYRINDLDEWLTGNRRHSTSETRCRRVPP